MGIADINLLMGWVGMLAGVLSGSMIGLFFHRQDWLGGYSSFRRRLVRLGHIAFFGLGFINVMFALTAMALPIPPTNLRLTSASLLVGALTMPLCCFLAAWRTAFRHLFPIPVASVLVGIGSLLVGWQAR